MTPKVVILFVLVLGAINGGVLASKRAGTCTDHLPNCDQYGDNICTDPTYDGWVNDNCAKRCGKCGSPATAAPPVPGTGPGTASGGSSRACVDNNSNCVSYGNTVCSDPTYTQWVDDNCAKFCGGCTVQTTAAVIVTQAPATGTCVDAITSCSLLLTSTNICSDPASRVFAEQNCAKTCNMCSSGGPQPAVTSAPATAYKDCSDAVSNCKDYGTSVCSDSTYAAWVNQNCKLFCGICTVAPMPATSAPATAAPIPATHAPVPVPGGCSDTLPNCKDYGQDICSNPTYTQWVASNCQSYCHLCGGSGPAPQTSAPLPVVLATTAAPVPVPGPGCADKIPNCQDYEENICADPTYSQWAMINCKSFCRLCGSGPASQTSAPLPVVLATTAAPVPVPGPGCADKIPNCQDYEENICADPTLSQWAMINCKSFCRLCGSGPAPQTSAPLPVVIATTAALVPVPGPGCADKIPNCQDYEEDICAEPTYSQWAMINCKSFCKLCGVQTQSHLPATAPTQSIHGGSTGCVYAGQVYQQGAVWRDGCKFNCTCVEGVTGKYQCLSLCMDWSNLPTVCSLDPPAPGKCCQKPNCPDGYIINYPANYHDVK